MKTTQEYVNEWIKLGYTKEQSEELARLSTLGSVGDIEAHVADRSLYETLKRYETEKGLQKE